MENSEYWTINQTWYNVDDFVDESINLLLQELIKVHHTIFEGLYVTKEKNNRPITTDTSSRGEFKNMSNINNGVL